MLEDSLPLEASVPFADSLPLEDPAADEGSELVEDSPSLEDSVLDDDFEAALGAACAALSFAVAAWSLCELEPADLAVPLAVELPASVVVEAALTACPENVCSATAASTPVSVTLPAMIQRLMRVSFRSAASLDFTS